MDKTSLYISIIQTLLSLAACILAWVIPKRIMWEQTYSSLGSEYRSYDFAIAVQDIVEFFTITCQSDIEKVPHEYKKRFFFDMYGLNLDDYSDFEDEDVLQMLRSNKKLKINQNDATKVLHYHKRLLTQYFHDLCSCAKSPFIGKRRVKRDYTKSEAKIMKILFLMNKAVDESPILYKDISSDFRMPSEKRANGMNKDFVYLYALLSKSGRFMDI
ncbi:MAG: hypothetical protein IJ673_03845 [Treponema sp.]|nr:hypothetical protein [Treponema sp.]